MRGGGVSGQWLQRGGSGGEEDVAYAFDVLSIVLLVGIDFGMMKRRGRRHGGGGSNSG